MKKAHFYHEAGEKQTLSLYTGKVKAFTFTDGALTPGSVHTFIGFVKHSLQPSNAVYVNGILKGPIPSVQYAV